jgi:hypothetical protein
MSLRYRYVARITVRSIAAAMKHRGGRTLVQIHLRLPAHFGLKPIHCQDRNRLLGTPRRRLTRGQMTTARAPLGPWRTNLNAKLAGRVESHDFASAN